MANTVVWGKLELCKRTVSYRGKMWVSSFLRVSPVVIPAVCRRESITLSDEIPARKLPERQKKESFRTDTS